MKVAAVRLTLIVCLIAVLILALPLSGEATRDESLVLYLPFDEVEGDVTKDPDGPNTGKLEGGAAWTNDGKYGGAISFDGVDDYVIVGDSGFGTMGKEGDSYTVELWLKTSQAGGPMWDGGPIVIEKRGIASHFRTFALHPNANSSISVYVEIPPEDIEAPSPTVNDGEWHHICFVREGADVTLYVDGDLATGGIVTDNDKSTPNEPITIGCRRDDGDSRMRFFNGSVDEVAIYTRGLTDAEVKRDVNGIYTAVSSAGKLTTTWASIKM